MLLAGLQKSSPTGPEKQTVIDVFIQLFYLVTSHHEHYFEFVVVSTLASSHNVFMQTISLGPVF